MQANQGLATHTRVGLLDDFMQVLDTSCIHEYVWVGASSHNDSYPSHALATGITFSASMLHGCIAAGAQKVVVCQVHTGMTALAMLTLPAVPKSYFQEDFGTTSLSMAMPL